MKTARKLLIIAGLIVIAAIITAVGLAYYTVRRPLPKQEGEIVVPGMQDAITVYRDSWGVPHIYAATPYDLFFAQGFAHAQDRWWQMDINRHIGHGTLSELLGENEEVQNADRLIRALGWSEIAQANWDAASSETRAALEAYAAGVNAYIMERSPGELALEYSVLNLRMDDVEIAPWTPLDSLAWQTAFTWQTGGNAAREIENAQALTRVDESMLALYNPLTRPGTAPTILTAADLGLGESSAAAPDPGFIVPANVDYTRLPLDEALALFDLVGPRSMPDDSAWVVSGTMTTSGKPLLATAPGLPIQMPSAWYEIGLFCLELSTACPYSVSGFSLPGLPTVFIGHNERIAWSITSAWIDEQDILIISLDPDDPSRYAWDGGWRVMDVIDDTLAVNGLDDPVPFTIYRTHLGPVITMPPLSERDQAFVVHWTAQHTPVDPVGSLLALNRAQTWDDFRAALSTWGGTAANVLYADVDGNIGYQLAGRVPVRAGQHSGLLPVPGEDETATWRGFLPFDALPSVLNPASGAIVTANNPVVPPEYAAYLLTELGDTFGPDATYTLAVAWDSGYRAARIQERLLDQDTHTTDTFAAIQGDTYSAFAAEVMPYLLKLNLEDETLAEMQGWLGEWDFRFTIDSPQAALFAAYWHRLAEFTYGDELGVLPCDCTSTRRGITQLLAFANHPWWDDVRTRFVVERRNAIQRKAFEQAITDLVNTLGDNRDEWRWGDLHTVTFSGLSASSLGIDLIESQFDRGPVEVSGSVDTINATRSQPASENRFRVSSAPSARMIVDLGALDLSRAMHTTGQSNHLASEHYDDMIDPWRYIEYHTMLWNRTSIEEAADAMLALEPVYIPAATPTAE